MHKFILLVTLWLSIPGCQFLSAEPGSFYTENKGGIMFQVDPRIELLAVVQYLSGSNLVCSDETGYSMAIDQWFAGHREHPLIPLWQKLEKRGFTYDAPVAYFLQFESIAFRDKQNKFPSYYGRILTDRMEKVIRKQAEERELLESLRDFASQSRFEEFMSSQADYYQEQIKATAALLPDKDISGTITTWFGSAQNSFNFIVTPLYVTNGYGPCLQNAEGGLDLYCISAGQTDGLSLLTLLVHEFSHSYINPLVEEHYQRLKKARKLYKPIRKQMVAQAYTDWWVTLVEHYVRAATIRIYARLMDQSEVSAKLSGESKNGFIYIFQIDKELQRYETLCKSEGITFRDFFPQLVVSMEALSKNPASYIRKNTAFNGNINNVFAPNILIIVPETRSDSTVAKYILPNAEFVASRIGGKIITDTQALKLKPNKNPLIVYGCQKQNLWLAKYLTKMRFQILPDRIIAKDTYLGMDLRIITAEPNPLNRKLGMVVYTAQTPEAMKGINSIFHGPQEYVVSDSSGQVLGEGFYPEE